MTSSRFKAEFLPLSQLSCEPDRQTFHCFSLLDHQNYTIYRQTFASQDSQLSALRIIQRFSRLSHQNVQRYYNIWSEESVFYVQLEARPATLFQQLSQARQTLFPQRKSHPFLIFLAEVYLQLINGIEALYAHGLRHVNLLDFNDVYYDSHGTVKLGELKNLEACGDSQELAGLVAKDVEALTHKLFLAENPWFRAGKRSANREGFEIVRKIEGFFTRDYKNVREMSAFFEEMRRLSRLLMMSLGKEESLGNYELRLENQDLFTKMVFRLCGGEVRCYRQNNDKKPQRIFKLKDFNVGLEATDDQTVVSLRSPLELGCSIMGLSIKETRDFYQRIFMENPACLSESDLFDLANIFRVHCIEMTEAPKSGHATTCSSMAELMAVLFFDPAGMTYDPKDLNNLHNDKLILSKGHAAPILYVAWAYAGCWDISKLTELRRLDSDLEGHPTPRLPFVDVATGSLGQGLGVACGMAYASKYLDNIDNRYYVMMGDGETAEGSVWEAANFACHYKLDNIVAIVDLNRLGQCVQNMFDHDEKAFLSRFEGFGWLAILIDGHSVKEIREALNKARETKGRPVVIVAKTFKGKNMTELIENQLNWHGKPIGPQNAKNAIEQLKKLIKNNTPVLSFHNKPLKKQYCAEKHTPFKQNAVLAYDQKAQLPSRVGYGNALKRLGGDIPELVVLDADTKTSTYSCIFEEAFPKKFLECYIAEQNMISVALGLYTRGKIAFLSSFGAFLERGYDQLRMAGISKGSIKLHGSHVGVSIGEDGPSQMALEDISLYKPVPGMHILYPSDPVACERAVEIAMMTEGLFYIRSTRPPTPIIYGNDEVFELGKLKVVKSSPSDCVLVISGGITLHEALKASQALSSEGVNIRVVDIFSVKPLDVEGVIREAAGCNGLILVVEDHYENGGIKDSVSSLLSTRRDMSIYGLAVKEVPRSGTPGELVARFGIDSRAIGDKVREILMEWKKTIN